MPQGSFKKSKLPQILGRNKKKKNDALRKKTGKPSIKKKEHEGKKFRAQLAKSINAKIEEDCKSKASQEATSFKILKSSSSSDSKKKK